MIRSFGEVNNNLINEVCSCFEKNNFNFLKEKYPYLDHNVIYSILYSTGKYNKQIYNYLSQINIKDRKILIISDTHYGSIYEDMNYTYEVFNFAKARGINTILHGGDIIEGNCNQSKGHSIISQANYFIKKYPNDYSINTYALFGNHDYLAINENKRVRDILSSRNDINILGFKKVYLKWCGVNISLQHEIGKFKLNLPIRGEYLSFKGHSHYYHVREEKNGKTEKIFIPSLSDDPVPGLSSNPNLNMENLILKPGFLTAQINESNIIVNNYSLSYGKITKENEFSKVLRKR